MGGNIRSAADADDRSLNPTFMNMDQENRSGKNTLKAGRSDFADELARLREKALAQLEAQGFDVRGKTPKQVRLALRAGRSKRRNHSYRALG